MSYPQMEKSADFQIGSVCLQAQQHRSANQNNPNHWEGSAITDSKHISYVCYKVERLKTVKLCYVQSCFGCLFTWSRHVQRAELQISAQSWQLHTPKLQCATCYIRYCQPHRLSDNRTLLSAPFSSQPTQQRCPTTSPPPPWAQQAHTLSFATKMLKCR